MASDVEIERAMATVSETLNDQKVRKFDRDRVQEIAGSPFTVDDGGGVHDESGTRVACTRRTPSGQWIVERQNTAAENADAAIPAPAPGGEQH